MEFFIPKIGSIGVVWLKEPNYEVAECHWLEFSNNLRRITFIHRLRREIPISVYLERRTTADEWKVPTPQTMQRSLWLAELEFAEPRPGVSTFQLILVQHRQSSHRNPPVNVWLISECIQTPGLSMFEMLTLADYLDTAQIQRLNKEAWTGLMTWLKRETQSIEPRQLSRKATQTLIRMSQSGKLPEWLVPVWAYQNRLDPSALLVLPADPLIPHITEQLEALANSLVVWYTAHFWQSLSETELAWVKHAITVRVLAYQLATNDKAWADNHLKDTLIELYLLSLMIMCLEDETFEPVEQPHRPLSPAAVSLAAVYLVDNGNLPDSITDIKKLLDEFFAWIDHVQLMSAV